MPSKNKQLFIYFAGSMLAAGILFFLAAGLADEFKKLVIFMNDRAITKTAKDWLLFFVISVPVGAIWIAAWLWFKGCEKRFLETWFSKN